MKLILIRHGQTAWSREDKLTSHTDIPLTEQGLVESSSVGVYLSRMPDVKHFSVFTSPSVRTRQTAAVARSLAPFEAVVCNDLKELDFGEYEGRKLVEIHEENPKWNLWVDGCEGGESISTAMRRASSVLRKAFVSTQNIVVFTHGAFIRILVAAALGDPASCWGTRTIPTGSITQLVRRGQEWVLVEVGAFGNRD